MNKLISIVMGLALGGFFLALPGCACWTDASKRNEPACVVAHAIVDCTVEAGKAYGPALVPAIVGLITGNPGGVDWGAIEKAAEAMGLKDGGCFLAELKQLLFNQSSSGNQAALAVARAVNDHLDSYRKKHFGDTNVKFKLIDKTTGKVVLL
jgi:hypothetical protein